MQARADRCNLSAAALVALIGLVCATPIALAQSADKYPDKPVKIFLPFGPGGVADVTARLVAAKLSERMGQQFVIENKPGAAAINAVMATKSGAPDGHSIFLGGNGVALSQTLFKSLPYDLLKDFANVSVLAQFDMLLVTRAEHEIGSTAKLVEVAKANPGKLNFGTVAAGSTQNLAAEMFKVVTGIEAAVVTFRTTPDLVTALLRGDVDVGFDYLAAFTASVADKKLKLIASGGEKRSPLTPDTQTVVEGGYPDYVVTSWNGLSVLAGTPRPIIDKLNKEINEVLKLPDVQARATQLGMEAVGTTPEGMAKRLAEDISRWRGVILKLGLQR